MHGSWHRELPVVAALAAVLLTGGASPAGATTNGATTNGAATNDPAATTSKAATEARVAFHDWTTTTDFVAGTARGVLPLPGPRLGIVIGRSAGTTTYHDPYLNTDRGYDYGTWTSPVRRLDFGATEMVASWSAQTPPGTWLKVELNATMEDGAGTGWLDMGHWAAGDGDIHRTSVSPSAAPYGGVDTDTFTTSAGHTVRAYQLRVTLYRAAGTAGSPRLWQVGAFASATPNRTGVPTSTPGPASAAGIELKVPRYSQNVHAGQYPEWDGGGEAWCSPTSTEMVVEYWGKYPSREQLAFVDPGYADPSVDVAARATYDYAYQGTGNWPFNTGYASSYGLDGQIVQLRSLDDVERLIAAGIPVITSQSFERGEIDGADYRTNGHLWVIVGFTKAGDVVVNDPASNSNPEVRNVYPRRQFETVWLRTSFTRPNGSTGHGTGGIAYVIKPHDKPLPPAIDPANPSW
ncbi:C39 family peptidase [Planosporangium mesophilum]|uniref:Membrane protein n=1 Tax=Planosporangium mesophilum TaxID=689768 RepID=A0A8J3TD96_9ACTN|nr:C39 family peptidase [Planosporangium mesophilum]NJC82783.1 peptidase C39 family protein [Planosporangium mesophilum]GII23747.1 membrane protein [Planosporangium mesophilum]